MRNIRRWAIRIAWMLGVASVAVAALNIFGGDIIVAVNRAIARFWQITNALVEPLAVVIVLLVLWRILKPKR